MHERWSLRFRVFLFFLLIILGSGAIITVFLWAASLRMGPVSQAHLVFVGVMTTLAIALLCLYVWHLFDKNVACAIEHLIGELDTRTHAPKVDNVFDTTPALYLGGLGGAMTRIAEALHEAHKDTEAKVQTALANSERQKAQLETVLHDLHAGIVICAFDYRVLLYNRVAARLLQATGNIGLGRSLFDAVSEHAIRHAVERLRNRVAEGRRAHNGGGVDFVCATRPGADKLPKLLQGHIALIDTDPCDEAGGFVITFRDATEKMTDRAARDQLVSQSVEALRRAAMGIQVATEILADDQLILDYGDVCQTILSKENDHLNRAITDLDNHHQALRASGWPMGDVYSSALFSYVVARIGGTCTIKGKPVRLCCDSFTVAELLRHLADRIMVANARGSLELHAARSTSHVHLDLRWRGKGATLSDIERWLDEPLVQAFASLTGREVLERHRGVVWPIDGDTTGLRLVLNAVDEATGKVLSVPERPVFYDFSLPQTGPETKNDQRLLKSLTYVVFDTETTGLFPRDGDRIVQIAGVRIVNGRLIKGEVFDTLVNPERRIPQAATRIHGIDDTAVMDAPTIKSVLPRFHAFIDDAVLVAHNAAFDIAFLHQAATPEHPLPAYPVLDTVLLSAYLFGQGTRLTLDALAQRFGISIKALDRHSALGDSMATAQVFLHLLDMLDGRGVTRLDQAQVVSNKMRAIRKKQARY